MVDSFAKAERVRRGTAGPSVLEELRLPPCEPVPYDTIEVLANHENVWANLQSFPITSLGFDLEHEVRRGQADILAV